MWYLFNQAQKKIHALVLNNGEKAAQRDEKQIELLMYFLNNSSACCEREARALITAVQSGSSL